MARIFDSSLVGFLTVWLAPLAGAMVFDRITHGRVHRVYLVTLATFLVAFARILVMEAELWMALGRALLGVFL